MEPERAWEQLFFKRNGFKTQWFINDSVISKRNAVICKRFGGAKRDARV